MAFLDIQIVSASIAEIGGVSCADTRGRPLSTAGQANRLMAVKGLFKFLRRENLLLYNPDSEIELPKLEKRLLKDILTAEKAERVLAQPDTAACRWSKAPLVNKKGRCHLFRHTMATLILESCE